MEEICPKPPGNLALGPGAEPRPGTRVRQPWQEALSDSESQALGSHAGTPETAALFICSRLRRERTVPRHLGPRSMPLSAY